MIIKKQFTLSQRKNLKVRQKKLLFNDDVIKNNGNGKTD